MGRLCQVRAKGSPLASGKRVNMKLLNRRIWLRGLGGAVVAAPYLGSLFARSARAQVAAPKRTILMFTHYGCITNRWFPQKLDGELTVADLQATTLAPLAPFAKKVLLPRGIRTMNEWTQNNKGAGQGLGQANDTHTQVVGSALTCQPVTPNSNDPFSFEQATKFNARPLGPSLDHVIAKQLSSNGEPLFMNTAGQTKEGAQSAISYAAAETIFMGVNAQQAYSKLTGLFTPGSAADTWESVKGKLLGDIVKSDLGYLRSLDMSREDKLKLDAWLQLASEVQRVIVAQQCDAATATTLGADLPLATGTGDALTRKVSDTMDNADLYSAIAALAAACNASPMIVLKYPNNFLFSGLGINSDSDNVSKRVESAAMNAPCAPNAIENILKIDAYYAQKFANLVKYLDALTEGDGTLLDSSVAVWVNECSDGAAHNLNNMPIVQAGSAGGYFKTGRIVNLDTASGATPEDMLGRSLSQCYMGNTDMIDGVDKGTGTDPKFGNRPVNKYYCNLMKAMGLRADANGYPAQGGPASEVTHFGYSDKTEDFCGGAGAVAGATIHEPGAFGELEA
jgi:hypothetical protein